MQAVTAIIRPFMLVHPCDALREIEGIPGITASDVMGRGKGKAGQATHRVERRGCVLARKTKVEVVVPASIASAVVDSIARAARTGNIGEGKVFVHELLDVVKIRTGEHGEPAARGKGFNERLGAARGAGPVGTTR